MLKKDYKRFAELMAGLSEIFTPDKIVSEAKTEIYFQAFHDWNIEQFQQACYKIMQIKKISTFPLPAELRETLEDKDEALKAWLMVRKAIGEHGYYMSVQFPIPLIHSVIDAMGGWMELCLVKTEEYIWKQKEFERLYSIMKERNEHPDRCLGFFEQQNQKFDKEFLASRGIKSQVVLIIDDDKKIRQIK